MKMPPILKIILANGLLICLVVVLGSIFRLLLLPYYNTPDVYPDKLFGWRFPVAKFPLTGPGGELIAYSSIRDPGGIPQGLPVRLQIPIIGVDTAIEDALITPDGRMDVPIGSVNVAWFSLGPHPGKIGSAVIGGHFGIDNGVPFVFYNLDKLKTGDKIYVIDDQDKTLAFVVKSISSFDRNADATTVFTSQDGIAHLNLITCEGVWNQVNGNYPLRLVVFTDAIPSEGSVTVKTRRPSEVTASPRLVPLATPTPLALTTPSQSVSLPSAAIPSSASLFSTNIIIQSINIMYATPVDGAVTSVLLLGILFVLIKIIRR